MAKRINKKNDPYLTEYWATHDAYLHYDTFSWQVGGVLIAGVFVFLGLLLQLNPPEMKIIVAGSTFVTLMMSGWILYADHNRQIYTQKLDRIHQLEDYFGFQQHLRWAIRPNPPCRLSFPSGHVLNILVYSTSCLASVILCGLRLKWTNWLLLPLSIWGAVLILLMRNYYKLKIARTELRTKKDTIDLSEPRASADRVEATRPQS